MAQEPARQQRRRADHVGDGVDPNRNFAEHWGYDNEGSSPDPADETYRGPSAASEPETQAMQGLIDRVKPRFQSNLHSFGQWLLYPQGWQVGTLDADYPLYVAARRHRCRPRDLRASTRGSRRDTLYVTNGETTDYADDQRGRASPTRLSSARDPGRRIRVPRQRGADPGGVQEDPPLPPRPRQVGDAPAESGTHRWASTSSRSTSTPTTIDPQNGQTSLFDFKFDVSYGDPQEVRVLAKRSLGERSTLYATGINGGPVQDARRPSEWGGGERYGPGDEVYYHVVAAR